MFGLITFANGALGQWVDHYAGHGEPFAHRMVFGTRGSIAAPGDRNGRPVRLVLDDGTDIADERILDYAPSYRLDRSRRRSSAASASGPTTSTSRRPTASSSPSSTPSWPSASAPAPTPEVDGATGKRAVALVYALFESQVAGRPVTIAEVESSAVDAYQREIDEHYGLVSG